MRVAEKALLLAVRDRLRTAIADGGAGYTDQECQVEMNEMVPAIAGQTYVIVTSGGWQTGPRHRTSGGIADLIYGVDVIIVKRATHVPRDRWRDVFVQNLDSLTTEIDKIFQAIDWQYDVINAANATISKETGSTEGFIRPLIFASIDRRPREAPAALFAATGGQTAGLVRLMSFHGAQRITSK